MPDSCSCRLRPSVKKSHGWSRRFDAICRPRPEFAHHVGLGTESAVAGPTHAPQARPEPRRTLGTIGFGRCDLTVNLSQQSPDLSRIASAVRCQRPLPCRDGLFGKPQGLVVSFSQRSPVLRSIADAVALARIRLLAAFRVSMSHVMLNVPENNTISNWKLGTRRSHAPRPMYAGLILL